MSKYRQHGREYRLSYETKTIIGTILISELLHAIEHMAGGNREQFCIYIDEFQNFASYQDFPTLITQAPKYGIATTLAHHERYGQLAGNPEILGATTTMATKVLFQITPRDANELAHEFAEKQPAETRVEEQYIISQYPVSDLLHWHDNPQIRAFVDKYIRPMKERLQDIGGDVESERLTRQANMDIASMYRIQGQMEGVSRIERDNRVITHALSSAGQAIGAAGRQTRKLLSLAEERKNLRVGIRDLNKLLTAVMEGRITVGKSEFGDYMIKSIYSMISLSDFEKRAIKLYITLTHKVCFCVMVPFEVAEAYGLFPDLVEQHKKEADEIWTKNLAHFYSFRHRVGRRILYHNAEGNYISDEQATARVIPKDIPKELSDEDLRMLRSTIREHNKPLIEILETFTNFCKTLAEPENHIRVRSGQFVAKQANTRTEQDMVNEAARELTGLPKYTAYAKVLQDEGKSLWKGKIRTLELTAKNDVQASRLETFDHVEMRWKIEDEIRSRHERIIRGISDEQGPPPATY